MPAPVDYEERVYAGVLGKIIGVYLGRPFEGWSFDRLTGRFGEVNYYVHEQLNARLVVTDDDISGTFTFLRALSDNGCPRDITAKQIGETWLNYLIQNRTVLWWGGMGMSTENTAYLRLKAGIPAPESGSIAVNGRTVAEQIGAQIFIDGWGMAAPGDPELAAYFAKQAGSVSHDGEAVFAAQVIAAMEAAAFYEPDLNRLLEIGTGLIPKESTIFRLISDLREWHTAEPDWRKTRAKLDERYGYHCYGGSCHVVPNHGVVILGLLYGADDFQRSLMVTNTAGWDTDCNSGNVGCLMGIKNGLAGLETGPDWRGPVADRIYLPTADGGRCVTDALREAFSVARIGRTLAGDPVKEPKGGARYHFSLPGSVQGFLLEESPECRGTATVSNGIIPDAPGADAGEDRALRISFQGVSHGRACRVATATFVPPRDRDMGGYSLISSPSLYPGQTVHARIVADQANAAPVHAGLYLRFWDGNDSPQIRRGPTRELAPDASAELEWTVEESSGPIFEIGVEISSKRRADGVLYLDTLSWGGVPTVTFARPEGSGQQWLRAWVNGGTHFGGGSAALPFRMIQDEGAAVVSQGTRDWTDYTVAAELTPRVPGRVGLAARVQGQRRFVAVVLCPTDRVALIQVLNEETALAEAEFPWEVDGSYPLILTAKGRQVTATLPDGSTLSGECDPRLDGGAVGIFCDDNRVDVGPVSVEPA